MPEPFMDRASALVVLTQISPLCPPEVTHLAVLYSWRGWRIDIWGSLDLPMKRLATRLGWPGAPIRESTDDTYLYVWRDLRFNRVQVQLTTQERIIRRVNGRPQVGEGDTLDLGRSTTGP